MAGLLSRPSMNTNPEGEGREQCVPVRMGSCSWVAGTSPAMTSFIYASGVCTEDYVGFSLVRKLSAWSRARIGLAILLNHNGLHRYHLSQ
jgi:hypothetical protein